MHRSVHPLSQPPILTNLASPTYQLTPRIDAPCWPASGAALPGRPAAGSGRSAAASLPAL